MIQEYVMGGIQTQQEADLWLFGFQSDVFDLVSQGDFYDGNDKDLSNTITTIFNNLTSKVSQADIKINSGSSNP